MKRAIFLPLLCLALAVMAQPRQEIYLEKGWRFTRGDISGAADPAFDDSRWESVEVPHDWAIYGPFDKEIDKQVVAIEQGRRNCSYGENRTYRSVAVYRRRVV